MVSKAHSTIDTYLKSSGYRTAKVEHYNSFTKRQNDLFGLFDLLAMNGSEILGVQVTSQACKSEHIEKWRASELLPVWLSSGGRAIMVFVDTKAKPRTPIAQRLQQFEFRLSNGSLEIIE